MDKELIMLENSDEESFTHFAINNEEQIKINKYLSALEIGTRKRQNIKEVRVNVKIIYHKKVGIK